MTVAGIPSRVFVGVLVFGLITVLVTLPYTFMMLTGYRPPPGAPYDLLFPRTVVDFGDGLFLVLASLFSILLTVVAWRALLTGAREDATRRRRHDQLKRELRQYMREGKGPFN